MLLLKKHLVALVREGKKRQTIRLWSRALVRPGQISFTPGLGRMRILAVDTLASLDALTEVDARADGFVDRAALLAEIRKIYGTPAVKKSAGASTAPASASRVPATPADTRTLFRITFEWPIDAAGNALVLASPQADAHVTTQRHEPVPHSPIAPTAGRDARARATVKRAKKIASKPAAHRTSPRSATPTQSRQMSPAQRQTLRGFVLSHDPAEAS